MPTENISPDLIQRADKPEFLTEIGFEAFGLPQEIQRGLIDAGFLHCTPIQAQVLPISLPGRDVAGQAQTGTGKTAAFLVTVFARLLGLDRRKPGLPSALVVAPTRELALQIYQDAQLLGKYTGLSLVQVVGGVGYQKQANALRQGADIIIGTPGRIIDYCKQNIFIKTFPFKTDFIYTSIFSGISHGKNIRRNIFVNS